MTVARAFGVPFVLVGLVLGFVGAAVPAAAEDSSPPAAEPTAAEPSAAEDENDPAEGLMRVMFEVHNALDKLILRPAATMYTSFTPPVAQEAIGNVTSNLREPLVFVNDVLQGEFDRAGVAAERFFVNSTEGFFGFRDKATEKGIIGHDEDFGQTFAAWGAEDGPYMVLPVIGPTNPRDALGKAIDILLSPPGVGGVQALEKRAAMDAELETLEKTSLDYYATLRSAYRQNRDFEIKNREMADGEGADVAFDVPGIDDGDM